MVTTANNPSSVKHEKNLNFDSLGLILCAAVAPWANILSLEQRTWVLRMTA